MTGDDWHEYFEMFPDESPAASKEPKLVLERREQLAREQAALDAEMARIIAKHNKPKP